MCNFFSVCSKDGKPYYFDWALREKVIKGELKFEPDSHTSILDYYGFKGLTQDRFNKYEYNPFTKVFQIDQMNNEDDHLLIEDFCKKLDFKTIVPQLTFNPIIHPFKDRKPRKVTKKDLKLLKQWVSIRDSAWDSVGYSVWDSVWASVRDSIGTSVGDSVGDSVRASVWDSVRNSVRNSVGYSVWASVRTSVGYSVWDSVGAYISNQFKLDHWKNIKHKKGVNPYQCLIDLWEKGLVPSHDGKIWRLYGGEKAKVMWEGKI